MSDSTLERIWKALEAVPDPEIPVVSIRELGILRDVRRLADSVIEVVITPTYSGCPAMSQIAEDIHVALRAAGVESYRLTTILAPAWTTDWMTEEARDKLRRYGIAPPVPGRPPTGEQPVAFVRNPLEQPVCPRCGSRRTVRVAQFGSTACKALYRCLDCREPFDYFKRY
ncbi:phenylacetate-CoA oxygenase subunit PaaJ [Paraburkholderia sediminicola]|uniref:1,2-phenylacetyl-CoA epoxidase subunit PaaD n=1 Tax=Paraburkholderia sediminicola TaxID=458836 RepID=UPI0038B75FC0